MRNDGNNDMGYLLIKFIKVAKKHKLSLRVYVDLPNPKEFKVCQNSLIKTLSTRF